MSTSREVKAAVRQWLASPAWPSGLPPQATESFRRLGQALLAALKSLDDEIRWRAVIALGEACAEAEEEEAREVARRLLWSLNEESGSIGWGAPEALGEICARRRELAADFLGRLVSFLCPGVTHLEFPPLQAGTLWGLGRLARAWPDLVRGCGLAQAVKPYLDATDPSVRGMAAWCLGGILGEVEPEWLLNASDPQQDVLYWEDSGLARRSVGEIARRSHQELGL